MADHAAAAATATVTSTHTAPRKRIVPVIPLPFERKNRSGTQTAVAASSAGGIGPKAASTPAELAQAPVNNDDLGLPENQLVGENKGLQELGPSHKSFGISEPEAPQEPYMPQELPGSRGSSNPPSAQELPITYGPQTLQPHELDINQALTNQQTAQEIEATVVPRHAALTPVSWANIDAQRMERAHSQHSVSAISSHGPTQMGPYLQEKSPVVFVPTNIPHRPENGIVFGGHGESLGSSPTMPPSAGSTTYTHSTPLSDSGAHPSYKGHTPSHDTARAGGYKRPSQNIPNHVVSHDHSASFQSISSGTANGEDVYRFMTGPGSFLSPGALYGYLLNQFDDPAFADCVVDVELSGEHMAISGHSMLLARSETLRRQLLGPPNVDPSGVRHLSLCSNNNFLTAASIRDVLQVCYGAPLPSPQRRAKMSESPYEVPNMRTYLADLAAGQLLGIWDVCIAASACIRQILNLDSVDELLAFIFADSPGLANHHGNDGEAMANPLAQISPRGPWTFELINAASTVLMSHMLHHPFVFDASAPPSAHLHGYPAVDNTSPPSNLGPQHKRGSSSRVVGIQFGDFSSTPDAASTAISSVLLSLPHHFLRHLLIPARPASTGEIVAERERRRTGYLEYAMHNNSGNPGPAAYWKESYDASEGEIRRVWVG